MRRLFTIIACTLMSFATQASAAFTDPGDKAFLYETVRHLYRWYLDETDAAKVVNKEEIVFWVKELKPELDEADKSRFAKVVIPQLKVEVSLKLADYEIPELDVVVKSEGFKIIRVGTIQENPAAPDWQRITTSYKEMTDYLFANRKRAEFPDDKLLLRMRVAAHEAVAKELKAKGRDIPKTKQTLHVSAMSPVANEVWIYWEEGNMLVHFGSDIDLSNEGLWKHKELAIRVYDIEERTVVTLDEVAGSNAYMTRDQVGRALFNCIVLGKRIYITPMNDAETDAARKTLNE